MDPKKLIIVDSYCPIPDPRWATPPPKPQRHEIWRMKRTVHELKAGDLVRIVDTPFWGHVGARHLKSGDLWQIDVMHLTRPSPLVLLALEADDAARY